MSRHFTITLYRFHCYIFNLFVTDLEQYTINYFIEVIGFNLFKDLILSLRVYLQKIML